MTRSLTLKLTLAFLVVGLIGAMLVALFVWQRTQREFNQFVANRGQSALIATLARHYEATGSWQGVASVVMRERAGQPNTGGRPTPIKIWDVDGRIVFGGGPHGAGSYVSKYDRARGAPIKVGD